MTFGQNGLLLLFGRLIREIFLEPINRELGGTTVTLFLTAHSFLRTDYFDTKPHSILLLTYLEQKIAKTFIPQSEFFWF